MFREALFAAERGRERERKKEREAERERGRKREQVHTGLANIIKF